MEGLRPQWALKAMVMIIMASILFRGVSARNHTVGGISGWDLTSNIQAWASESTFHVGDSLVFLYTPVHDVLEVEEEDYQSCDVSEPIKTYNDGETVIPLTKEGTRFFICGRQGHCPMGLKLEAQVLASSANETKSGRSPPVTPPAPETPNPPPRPRSPPPPTSTTPPPSHAPGPTSSSPHNMPLVTFLMGVIITILISDWSMLVLLLGYISHPPIA